VKWFFYLLLLANVGYLAYTQLLAGGRDGESVAYRQLYPEKIKLIKPKEVSTAPVTKPAQKPEAAPSASKPLGCLEWGAFSGNEQARVQEALEKLQLGDKVTLRSGEETVDYWVYIPPLKSKKDAEKKIGELKARGIAEYFLVQDNSQWHNAISLGIFKSEDLARSYLAKLQAKGVKSAVIGERNQKVKRIFFQIRGVGDAQASKLAELQSKFSGSELKTVDCAKFESASAVH
jgi:SPOR domain